jgi:hypothetical protein
MFLMFYFLYDNSNHQKKLKSICSYLPKKVLLTFIFFIFLEFHLLPSRRLEGN